MTLRKTKALGPEALAPAAQERVLESLPEAQGLFFAPGRVNLMGDHIDYLGGVVLPMSLTEGTVLAAVPKAPGAEAGLEVWALDASEKALLSSKDLERPLGDWRRRLVAVLAALGLTPEAAPFHLAISGTLAGGGLSSSASLPSYWLAGFAKKGSERRMTAGASQEFSRRWSEIMLAWPAASWIPSPSTLGRWTGRCASIANLARPLPLPWASPKRRSRWCIVAWGEGWKMAPITAYGPRLRQPWRRRASRRIAYRRPPRRFGPRPFAMCSPSRRECGRAARPLPLGMRLPWGARTPPTVLSRRIMG